MARSVTHTLAVLLLSLSPAVATAGGYWDSGTDMQGSTDAGTSYAGGSSDRAPKWGRLPGPMARMAPGLMTAPMQQAMTVRFARP